MCESAARRGGVKHESVERDGDMHCETTFEQTSIITPVHVGKSCLIASSSRTIQSTGNPIPSYHMISAHQRQTHSRSAGYPVHHHIHHLSLALPLELRLLLLCYLLVDLGALAWLVAVCARRQRGVFLAADLLDVFFLAFLLALGLALELVGDGALVLCGGLDGYLQR